MTAIVTRRRAIALGAAGVSAAALGACSSGPVPTDTYYRLGAGPAVTPLPGGPVQGTLEVPPFRTEGILNERAMLYRDGANGLAQYSYHAWIEPPSDLLQRAFVEALRGANAFTAVATPEMRLDRDYELQGNLLEWEQVPSPPGVAIAMEIGLRRIRGDQEVLLKTYRDLEPATDDTADAAVSAFTAGLNKIIGQFLADLAALPKTAQA